MLHGPPADKIMNGRMSGMTFAVLNSDGMPEECDLEQWQRWFFEGGGRNQMRIKRDLVNHWEIETLFRGNSVAIEGPPPFWEVTAHHFSRPPFLERFGTKAAALELHEKLMRGALAKEPIQGSLVLAASRGERICRAFARMARG
jgi:hypothetical protein